MFVRPLLNIHRSYIVLLQWQYVHICSHMPIYACFTKDWWRYENIPIHQKIHMKDQWSSGCMHSSQKRNLMLKITVSKKNVFKWKNSQNSISSCVFYVLSRFCIFHFGGNQLFFLRGEFLKNGQILFIQVLSS